MQYPKNPVVGYLDINSLRNKIVDLREIMSAISLDYFVVNETKLDSSFPFAGKNQDISHVIIILKTEELLYK